MDEHVLTFQQAAGYLTAWVQENQAILRLREILVTAARGEEALARLAHDEQVLLSTIATLTQECAGARQRVDEEIVRGQEERVRLQEEIGKWKTQREGGQQAHEAELAALIAAHNNAMSSLKEAQAKTMTLAKDTYAAEAKKLAKAHEASCREMAAEEAVLRQRIEQLQQEFSQYWQRMADVMGTMQSGEGIQH